MANERYEEFLNYTRRLIERLTVLNTPDTFGMYTALDGEDIAQLRTLYDDAFRKAGEFIGSVPLDRELTQDEQAQVDYCNLMQDSFARDADALEKAAPGMTFPDILRGARTLTVDITDKELSTAGYVLSQRIAITAAGEDGKQIRGFFTPRMTLDPTAELERIRKHYCHTSPQFELYINELCGNAAQFKKTNEIERVLERNGDAIIEKYKGEPETHDDIILHEKELREIFKNMHTDYKRFKNTEYDYRDERMGRDSSSSPIDTRNVAMSRVAHLLGCDGVIAKSSPMELIDHGYIQEGSFIEFADGIDPLHIKPDSPILDINDNALDNTDALRQLSDLNVLDYICMNNDRHKFNMMYRIDTSVPGNPKISGIVGFDNDMSFSTNENFDRRHSGLDAINNMSESMAAKIRSLSDEMLIHSLYGTHLEKDNILPAVSRLNKLRAKLNKGDIKVIPDGDFVNYTYNRLAPAHGENAFTNAHDMIVLAKKGELRQNIEKPEPDEDIYAKEWKQIVADFKAKKIKMTYNLKNKLNGLCEASRRYNKDKERRERMKKQGALPLYKDGFERSLITGDTFALTGHKNRLSAATQNVHNGSEEYDNAMAAIDRMKELTERYTKSTEKPVLEQDLVEVRQAYADTYRECAKYIARKTRQKKIDSAPTSKPGRRIAAVRKAMEFCRSRVEALNETLCYTEAKERNELKKEADTLALGAFAEMDRAALGNYLRSLNASAAQNAGNDEVTSKLGSQLELVTGYILKNNLTEECRLSKQDLLDTKKHIEDARKANAALNPLAIPQSANPAPATLGTAPLM